MKLFSELYRTAARYIPHKKVKGPDDILIENIIEARSEMERAEHAFNELTDNTAIDYAAYNIMAARARYVHLLNIAKENNVRF